MNSSLSSLLILAICSSGLLAADWPEFLGADGRATSSEIVPTQWSESNNLVWMQPLPGKGSSSPIVVEEQVVVTCFDLDAAKRSVVSFDKNTGKHLWKVDFPVDYREDSYSGYLTEHGYASNTPASDGKNVYVFLGKGGVHAISLQGGKLWSVDAGKESSNRAWGSGSSVLVYGDMIIVNAADESRSLLALDSATGKQRWKQDASMLELTYGTPRLVKLPSGRTELVINVPGEMWGLAADTGKFLWYAETPMTGNVSPSPIVDGQTIYGFGGYRGSGSIAVSAGGRDDVSSTNTKWSTRLTSYVATPLLHEGRFYWIDDRGVAYSADSSDGSQIYRTRVDGIGSGRPVYASPVMAGGKIYVVTRRNGTIVYEPGNEFKIMARNVIEGDATDFNASPAISDGRIYMRSDKALYCIGETH